MFHVPCLGIWWRHDIWILKKIKNLVISRTKRAFEVKKTTFVSQVLSFRHTKQTTKNVVVDTTFNVIFTFRKYADLMQSKKHRLKNNTFVKNKNCIFFFNFFFAVTFFAFEYNIHIAQYNSDYIVYLTANRNADIFLC